MAARFQCAALAYYCQLVLCHNVSISAISAEGAQGRWVDDLAFYWYRFALCMYDCVMAA
jgi:hypothetical protein